MVWYSIRINLCNSSLSNLTIDIFFFEEALSISNLVSHWAIYCAFVSTTLLSITQLYLSKGTWGSSFCWSTCGVDSFYQRQDFLSNLVKIGNIPTIMNSYGHAIFFLPIFTSCHHIIASELWRFLWIFWQWLLW